MLAAMFAAFLLQIAFRYLLNLPIGWTSEVSAILWIWMVLWGAALVLREEEEIRFDLVYAVAGARVRRVMFLVAAGAWLALSAGRSEEHTSELQSLMGSKYAVLCLKHTNTIRHCMTPREQHTHFSHS